MVRVAVPVPFPQAGGPANVYLLEQPGGGLTLFDAGLGSPAAEEALARGFREAGRRFRDVERIVISHGHVDHYGAARTILEWSGREVPVFAHRADIPKISEKGPRFRDQIPHYAAYFARLGVPGEPLRAVARDVAGGFRLARRLAEVRPLAEGETLRTRHLSLEVVHMPGHTPGLLCLHDRRERLFLAGDHLLEKVSPNPLIELGPGGEEGRWKPLVAYLESVARLRALDVRLVLPGHGPPFAGHRRVIDELVRFYGKRQARIRQALAGGPRSAWEVVSALFPRAGPEELFLTVSETLANLEVLEARGEVAREVEGGVYRFRLGA